MLGFDKYFENKTLLYSAGAVAFLVAALLILFIFRLAFGRRLHMPGGGRARQPRLGIVDAFDLDRQRQLVLVRRDNVEHLVMIGGPNDVLIESQIVRAEARDLPRPRDKEPSVASLNWPASGPMSLSPSSVTEPRLLPEDTAVAARDLPKQAAPENAPAVGTTLPAAPVKLPAATPPSPRPPFLPLPPRRPITMPSFSLKPTPRPAGDAGAGSTVENGQTPVVPASATPATKTSAAPLSRPPRPPPANPSNNESLIRQFHNSKSFNDKSFNDKSSIDEFLGKSFGATRDASAARRVRAFHLARHRAFARNSPGDRAQNKRCYRIARGRDGEITRPRYERIVTHLLLMARV